METGGYDTAPSWITNISSVNGCIEYAYERFVAAVQCFSCVRVMTASRSGIISAAMHWQQVEQSHGPSPQAVRLLEVQSGGDILDR